ncbi:MAG: DUF4157 domain-containing protein [Chthoniobacterales bacterium]
MRARLTLTAGLSFTPMRSGMLQRKCACGGTPGPSGECEACRKKKLQRATDPHAISQPPAAAVSPIVSEVLSSPGRPLDKQARAFMEPRFRHDFSHVRIHADEKAAASASAINAQAYTTGHQIVFGAGRYTPETRAGKSLLAHELVHVLQQEESPQSHGQPSLDDDGGSLEREADEAMRRIDLPHGAGGVLSRTHQRLQRTVVVDKPKDLIPNPTGKGVSQTNAATVEDYCAELCSAEKPKVDAGTGEMSMSAAFCSVPGIGGPRPAETAKTATGCTCLCDLVNSTNLWTIKIDDVSRPNTTYTDDDAGTGVKPGGTGGIVTVNSPNSPNVFGSVTASGKNVDNDPWLILGHELCGHGWLGNAGKAETAAVTTTVGRQPFTVDRENALRAEHGIEARGRSFRDPFCGESYERLKTDKAGTGKFDLRYINSCALARSRCKKPNYGLFKLEERIPEDVPC